jgi:hypothetical protein
MTTELSNDGQVDAPLSEVPQGESTPLRAPDEDPVFTLPGRRTLRAEMWIVLWLSIAASGLRSLLSLIDSLTRGVKLSSQSTTLITTYIADRPWLDIMFQITRIALALIPVLLVLHLLRRGGESLSAIGLDLSDRSPPRTERPHRGSDDEGRMVDGIPASGLRCVQRDP